MRELTQLSVSMASVIFSNNSINHDEDSHQQGKLIIFLSDKDMQSHISFVEGYHDHDDIVITVGGDETHGSDSDNEENQSILIHCI